MELNLEEMDLVRGGLSDVFYMRKFVKEDSAEYEEKMLICLDYHYLK